MRDHTGTYIAYDAVTHVPERFKKNPFSPEARQWAKEVSQKIIAKAAAEKERSHTVDAHDDQKRRHEENLRILNDLSADVNPADTLDNPLIKKDTADEN
jgi:hypothetical protein